MQKVRKNANGCDLWWCNCPWCKASGRRPSHGLSAVSENWQDNLQIIHILASDVSPCPQGLLKYQNEVLVLVLVKVLAVQFFKQNFALMPLWIHQQNNVSLLPEKQLADYMQRINLLEFNPTELPMTAVWTTNWWSCRRTSTETGSTETSSRIYGLISTTLVQGLPTMLRNSTAAWTVGSVSHILPCARSWTGYRNCSLKCSAAAYSWRASSRWVCGERWKLWEAKVSFGRRIASIFTYPFPHPHAWDELQLESEWYLGHCSHMLGC